MPHNATPEPNGSGPHAPVPDTTGIRPFKDALPIVVGYLPAGMTFGIIAADAGLPAADVIGFSAVVFAGAAQYMAVNLIVAGTAAIQIVAATFLLNFRHFLMSASLAPKLDERRTWMRMVLAFGITDETFAVASSHHSFDARYLGLLNLTAWSAWLVGTGLGFVAGALLPAALEAAMGVALYALFAALLVPRLRKSLKHLVPACIAAVLHVVLLELTSISQGWSFVIAITCAAGLASLLTRHGGSSQ